MEDRPPSMPGRRLGRWLAGVAASGLLAGCGPAAPVVDTAGLMPDGPPAVPAAAPGGGPASLTWSPPADPAAGRTLDLCDDEDAILAGLDGGDLAADRTALEVTCVGTQPGDPSRRATIAADGTMTRPGMSDRGAGHGSADPDAPDAGEATGPPRPLMLGVLGRGAVPPAPAGNSRAGLAVAEDTVTVQGRTVRGLVDNTSGDFQDTIEVIVTGPARATLGRMTIPLTAQDGERVPFEFELDRDVAREDLSFVTTGRRATSAPVQRAMLLAGAPGLWVGPPGEFPGIIALRGDVPDGATIAYYESSLEVVVPRGHEVAADGLAAGVQEPFAIAAFLDEHGRVTDVVEPRLWVAADSEHLASRLMVGDTAVVGLFLPPDVADLALWVSGGSEK